jgi:hypothetical protein
VNQVVIAVKDLLLAFEPGIRISLKSRLSTKEHELIVLLTRCLNIGILPYFELLVLTKAMTARGLLLIRRAVS